MIDVKLLLNDLGIEFSASGVNEVKTRCWNPNHIDRKPSLNINLKNGVYHCLGCHISGNLFSLVRSHLGINGFEIVKYLSAFSKGGQTEDEIYKNLEKFIYSSRKPEVREFDKIEIPGHVKIGNHPYLLKRGFNPDEIKFWNMGIIRENNPYSPNYKYNNWIYIPIIFRGILRNYFLRDPSGGGKIYGSYHRSDILFGLDSCTDYERPLYLLEGIFDMISFRRTDCQAVAVLSNRILPAQIKNIRKFKKAVIVPDNDLPGWWLIHSAKEFLHNMEWSVCRLSENIKDANEAGTEELIRAINNEKELLEVLLEPEYLEWCKKNLS